MTTIPNPVTEAVARAIRDVLRKHGPWDMLAQKPALPIFEEVANAAILAHLLAIREATAQIIEAFKRTSALLAGSDFSEDEMIAMIFTAMIDQLIASAREAGT